MGEKALWPSIAGVGIVCTMVTALLLAGIEVAAVIAVFSIVGNFITLFVAFMLYGKVQKIETQTNGTMTTLQETNKDLIDTIKTLPPVEQK